MKPVLSIPLVALAVGAVLGAASPALACRVPPPSVRAEAAMPTVGFTAVVSSNERTRDAVDGESVTLVLDLERALVGEAPRQATVGGSLSDEIITSCGPIRMQAWDLAGFGRGTQVVVAGIQSPDRSLIIRQVWPIDSDRGRALLTSLETRAGNP